MVEEDKRKYGKFVAINYLVTEEQNKKVTEHLVRLLLDFLFRIHKCPCNFKIYTGVGWKGEEGIWLECEMPKNQDDK